jgi:hypothetical protein
MRSLTDTKGVGGGMREQASPRSASSHDTESWTTATLNHPHFTPIPITKTSELWHK